jgi:hypothetical protein
MLGIYREEELREAGEGGAAGGAGLATLVEEEEKADQACAALASPSITSTASSTSPLLQAEGGCRKSSSKRTCQKSDEATVDSRQQSREDLVSIL